MSMSHFEIFRSKKEWRWRLRSTNGKIVANSGESYKRRASCMKGIDVVICTGCLTQIKEFAADGTWKWV